MQKRNLILKKRNLIMRKTWMKMNESAGMMASFVMFIYATGNLHCHH